MSLIAAAHLRGGDWISRADASQVMVANAEPRSRRPGLTFVVLTSTAQRNLLPSCAEARSGNVWIWPNDLLLEVTNR